MNQTPETMRLRQFHAGEEVPKGSILLEIRNKTKVIRSHDGSATTVQLDEVLYHYLCPAGVKKRKS